MNDVDLAEKILSDDAARIDALKRLAHRTPEEYQTAVRRLVWIAKLIERRKAPRALVEVVARAALLIAEISVTARG